MLHTQDGEGEGQIQQGGKHKLRLRNTCLERMKRHKRFDVNFPDA